MEKPLNWNIAEPQKEGFFEGNVTSKKVIVDDLEEFQYDPFPFDDTGGSGHEKLENISVFENEEPDEGPDPIPFHLEKDMKPNEDSLEENTNTQGEGDTLNQMRILFGSEKKIREQSEAAFNKMNDEDNIGEEKFEPKEFLTPGLSLAQSQHEDPHIINSQVFRRSSFQDFSMKKFQEMMFEHNISDFMSSVERTVRKNKIESQTYRKMESKMKKKNSSTPKKHNLVSPGKFGRKELELDSYVGSKMRYMSEKKKARKSMLENYDSSLMKKFPQDPLNQSLEIYKAKFANYNTSSGKGIELRKLNTEKNLP